MPVSAAWPKSQQMPRLRAGKPLPFDVPASKTVSAFTIICSRNNCPKTHDPRQAYGQSLLMHAQTVAFDAQSAISTKMAFSRTRLKAIFSFIAQSLYQRSKVCAFYAIPGHQSSLSNRMYRPLFMGIHVPYLSSPLRVSAHSS